MQKAALNITKINPASCRICKSGTSIPARKAGLRSIERNSRFRWFVSYVTIRLNVNVMIIVISSQLTNKQIEGHIKCRLVKERAARYWNCTKMARRRAPTGTISKPRATVPTCFSDHRIITNSFGSKATPETTLIICRRCKKQMRGRGSSTTTQASRIIRWIRWMQKMVRSLAPRSTCLKLFNSSSRWPRRKRNSIKSVETATIIPLWLSPRS